MNKEMNKYNSRKTEFDGHAKFYKLPWKPRIFFRTIHFVIVLFIMNVLERIGFGFILSFPAS